MNRQMKYEEAMKRLQAIVDKMENGNPDIDTLTEQLKEAQLLIKMCRNKLTKTEAEIDKLMGKQE